MKQLYEYEPYNDNRLILCTWGNKGGLYFNICGPGKAIGTTLPKKEVIKLLNSIIEELAP